MKQLPAPAVTTIQPSLVVLSAEQWDAIQAEQRENDELEKLLGTRLTKNNGIHHNNAGK
jgi:hypothetical protein